MIKIAPLRGTVRALSRINFVVFSQLVGAELPRGVASIWLYHANLGIEIILNIIHLLYFFCLFLAEPVVMNRQEIFVLLI